jgi:hypothetical protein
VFGRVFKPSVCKYPRDFSAVTLVKLFFKVFPSHTLNLSSSTASFASKNFTFPSNGPATISVLISGAGERSFCTPEEGIAYRRCTLPIHVPLDDQVTDLPKEYPMKIMWSFHRLGALGS